SYNYVCGAGATCYVSDISYGEGKVCRDIRPPTAVDSASSLHLALASDRLDSLSSLLPVWSTPGANIHFYWESRPDPVSFAVGGALEEIQWRLRAIDVSETGERVRVYQ